MRVALLSPYSLSVPGGVQGQVLGLARALRAIGVDARVIGPTDGPPPEPGRHHRRPERRRRVQRQRSSPMVAGPDHRVGAHARGAARVRARRAAPARAARARDRRARRCSAARSRRSARSTPRRRTAPNAYKALRKIAVERGEAARGPRRGESRRRAMAEDALGGSYLLLPNGVDVDALRQGRVRHRRTDPRVLFCGRHEPRKGLGRAARRVGRPRPRRRALGRVRRPGDRGAHGAAHAARGVARSDHRGREARPARRGHDLLHARARARSRSASCCSRRWPRAPASSPRTSRATATSAVTT